MTQRIKLYEYDKDFKRKMKSAVGLFLPELGAGQELNTLVSNWTCSPDLCLGSSARIF